MLLIKVRSYKLRTANQTGKLRIAAVNINQLHISITIQTKNLLNLCKMIGMKSKLPHVGTTIFTKMSALAHQHNAINLSQGFPNFSPDQKLISLATKALEDDYNQYAPLAGKYSLRKMLTDKVYQLYKCHIDTEKEITMTAGATQAVFTAVAAMSSSGR